MYDQIAGEQAVKWRTLCKQLALDPTETEPESIAETITDFQWALPR